MLVFRRRGGNEIIRRLAFLAVLAVLVWLGANNWNLWRDHTALIAAQEKRDEREAETIDEVRAELARVADKVTQIADTSEAAELRASLDALRQRIDSLDPHTEGSPDSAARPRSTTTTAPRTTTTSPPVHHPPPPPPTTTSTSTTTTTGCLGAAGTCIRITTTTTTTVAVVTWPRPRGVPDAGTRHCVRHVADGVGDPTPGGRCDEVRRLLAGEGPGEPVAVVPGGSGDAPVGP